MKKLTNKKGFTIVELVIVIAVIAILAAVLIPTFSSVIHNANASSCMQECKSAYVEAYATVLSENSGNLPSGEKEYNVIQGSWAFQFDSDGLAAVKYIGSKDAFDEDDDDPLTEAYEEDCWEEGAKDTTDFDDLKTYAGAKYVKGYNGTFTANGDISVEYVGGESGTSFSK